MTRLDNTRTAAVDPDYYWRPIATAPLGAKLQLLTLGGVAVHGKLVRGWIGTVYGCMVGTTTHGRRFATQAEARRNAEIFVEECAEIVSNWAVEERAKNGGGE